MVRNHEIELPVADPNSRLSDTEWGDVFRLKPVSPAIGAVIRVTTRSGTAQQQHTDGAPLPDVILFVVRYPPKYGLRCFVSLAVLEVQRPIHFQRQRSSLSDVLPHSQGDFIPRRCREAPCVIDELHVESIDILPGWLFRARLTLSLAE